MIPRIAICLLLLLKVVSFTCAEEIRFAASDLLSDFIRSEIEAFSQASDLTIDMDGVGSLPALDQLRTDEIDLAIVADPDGSIVKNQNYVVFPYAYAISVVVVNVNNPMNELSLQQLGGIYGENEEFKYINWGDLGLTVWNSRAIKPMAAQIQESISLELFKHVVFNGRGMKTSVALAKPEEVQKLIQEDVAAIGLLSHVPKSAGMKTIMVSQRRDAPAYGPSTDNVHYGDYPIRLPFYVVYRERDEARLRDLLVKLYSDEVDVKLKANGLVALPESVRRKILVDFELRK